MMELFLVMTMALPSPHFTHPPLQCASAIDYERAKLEKFIRKNNPDAEVFIHRTPPEELLRKNGWERVPILWRNNQIWIRRKEISDKKIKESA